jgi:hypothetical protein
VFSFSLDQRPYTLINNQVKPGCIDYRLRTEEVDTEVFNSK